MYTAASANPATLALFSSVGLLVAMLAMVELGRRLGIRFTKDDPTSLSVGVGSLESAVFALLGLLVTFTFYGAANRFDERRHLIVEEANAIGTAYLRVDSIPSDAQPRLRDDFRQYLDARLDTYRSLPDLQAAGVHLARSITLQHAIWEQAVAGCHQRDAHPSACIILLPSITAMIDISTTRTMASATHPPVVVFFLLFWLSLCAALIAGFGMAASKKRRWLHVIAYTVMLTAAIYITLDIEYPRFGYVQVNAFDQLFREVRARMQ